jgi:PAS domain S-box-containing protein
MKSASEHSAEDPRLAAIVEASNDAIIAKDLNGVILTWNRAAERLFGYMAADIIGQPISIIFSPDQVGEEATILDRIGRGERIDHYEATRRHKDGHLIKVSVTVSPIMGASGKIIGALKIARDLTDRDARDRRIQELETELAHVQHLTELGQVVYKLIHEVNQPLTAIGNYANACRRLVSAGKQERVPTILERIAEQTGRAGEIPHRIRELVMTVDTTIEP